LKVVLPTTPTDAKGLLISAIRDDGPVIFIEHRWLYWQEQEVPEEALEYDPEVKELIDKSVDAANYQYAYSSSILGVNKLYSPGPTYDVYIKGDKIRKSYLIPFKAGEAYHSDIYLTGEEAFGVCSHPVIVCKGHEEAVSLDYDTYKLEMTPRSLTQRVPYEAVVFGKETFDNRKAKILEYFEDGKKVRLTVDIYSGLALKKFVHLEDEILEKHYFRDLAVGNVKDADVSVS